MKKNQIYLYILNFLLTITFLGVNAFGQEVTKLLLKGTLTDAQGQPVPSAMVSSDRSTAVVFTSNDGKFTVEVLPNEILLIEADGFEPLKTVATGITDGQNITLIKMPFHLGTKDEINMPFTTLKKRQLVSPVNKLNVSDIEKTDVKQDIFDLIRGRVPGVYGSNSIRGMGDALIVIDGFPRASRSGGSDFDMTNYLDVNEIEEITFLKDAASCMLYGAEAHQGVIMITTKRGEAHKTNVGIRAETGMKTPVSYPEFLDAADYMTMYNIASVNDGGTEVYSAEDIENTRAGLDNIRYPDEDFFNSTYLKDMSSFFRLTANASGGNEQARYYSKIGWYHSGDLYALEQEGKSFTNNELTFRGNVDYDVTDWLKSSLDAFFMFGADRQPVRDFWGDAASHLPNSFPMLIPLGIIPDETIADKAKVFDGSILGGTNQYKNNIYGNFLLGGFSTYTSRISQIKSGFDFDLGKITEGLTAQAKFLYDILNSYYLTYKHTYAVYQPSYIPATGYEGDSLQITKIGLDQPTQTQGLSTPLAERRLGLYSTVNYNRIFADKHNVSAVASGYWSKYDVMEAFYTTKYNTFGLSANYMFDNRLIAQFTGTLTGSGYLPEGSRYKAAPSIGFGWILSEEDFLAGNNMVNYLKVKASYGKILTDDYFPGYRIYTSSLTGGGSFSYNQNLASNGVRVFSILGNPGINLIARNELNVGFETMLAGKKLWIEGNYFQSILSGLITRRQDAYPAYIPVLQYENYEKYSDKGFDLGLTFSDKAGDFHYSLSANMVYCVPKAEVVEEPVYSDAPYRQEQGQAYDAIYGWEAMGLFRDEADISSHADQSALGSVIPGDIKYRDLNNDGKIDENDQTIIGNARARLGYGLNLTLAYKNFSLFALGTGQGGSHTIFENAYYWQVGNTAKYSDVALDSWTPATASTATYPVLHLNAADNNHRNSTYWIEENNWFTLHTLQLSYNIVPKFGKGLQLYLRGSNLLTVSPIKEKMELNIVSRPQMRTYALGCNVLF